MPFGPASDYGLSPTGKKAWVHINLLKLKSPWCILLCKDTMGVKLFS